MTNNASVSAVVAFLQTERLLLRPLEAADATPAYQAWLNDPEVLRYRGPKGFPTSLESVRNYVASIAGRGDLVLAIIRRDNGTHIGNVALNTIQLVHHSAELSIMIGDKSSWKNGFGKEVIRAVAKHGFQNLGLHRLWAESPNPAFNAVVKALGWTLEGTKRKAFLLDGNFIDIVCWGLLASEFNPKL